MATSEFSLPIKLRGKTWWLIKTKNGDRLDCSLETSDRKIAESKCIQILHEHERTTILEGKKPIKLHDAIDEYVKSKRNTKSARNVEIHIRHFRDRLPNHQLDRIENHEIQDAFDRLLDEDYAESTIRVSLTYLNGMFKAMGERKYTSRKPFPLPKKKTKGRLRWMDDGELKRFFDAIDPNVDYKGKNKDNDKARQDNWDMSKLLFLTASRFQEIANMTWKQVDFDRGMLVVHRLKGSNDSTMHLSREMLAILKRRRGTVEGDYVFPNKQGRYNEHHWVKDAVTRAKLSAVNGLPTLHTLRHSMACKLLQGGMNILDVRDYLGHKDLQSTLVYLHVIPGAGAAKALSIIDGA